ncbi:IS256 family transposase [Halanaerobiaceae bacterium Z-7014]|uniref:Mutator family transposase n=1 Tax=Halonatronomonas betaini TaxID=2778430 RepID=A0A931AWR3_9FIRM|nr:IS256 family transposase [Halonatronomonas betaini]MBF8436208.1 IS256 family transposase [Halonatronomonas betaini]
MAQLNITLNTELLHELFPKETKDQAFTKLLEEILNQVLLAQSAEQLGAAPYERSEQRTAYRNGFRDRDLTTRIGTITLRVPRHRNGEFSTSMFQRYQRSEQALILTMIEMVINGVSTRKIENVTEELCGKSFSKSTVSNLCKQLDPIVKAFQNRQLEKHYPFLVVDAIYLKVRENGRVRSKGLLIAKVINESGHREIIGFQMANSESETSWSDFFSYLQERGLADVDLVVSDNHKGLVKAIQKHFQGATWQRCQTHFSKNILDKTPKRLKAEVKAHLRSIYDARDINEARRLLAETLAKFERSAAKAMDLLEEGFEDILAVIGLPEKYRKRLRTTNSIERLNEEIRRRDRVIRIYPNEASAIRLIGALLIEHDEKWSTGRKYLDMEEYYDFLKQKKKAKTGFIA